MDSLAHRHSPAPRGRRRRADVGLGAGRGAQRACRCIAGPGRRRPDRRGDDDARHHLPVHGQHPAGEARRCGRTRVRCAGRVLRLRLRAGDRRSDGRRRHCAQRRRRGRRSVFTDPRLERPRHVRAVWRRCGCGGARALDGAGHPVGASAFRWTLQGHPVRTWPGEPGCRNGKRRSCEWTVTRCSSSPSRCWPKWPTRR